MSDTRVLRCPKGCHPRHLIGKAVEYHTYSVSEHGDFEDDCGCDDSDIKSYECGECGAEAQWVDKPVEKPEENENLLTNFCCPKCGHTKKFIIRALQDVAVTDDGIDPDDDAIVDQNVTWDLGSYCKCPKCKFAKTVADFSIRKKNVF